jgi:hypothetical protein
LENHNLVEKLSLQAESFQEGFDILSKSFSLNEMVENFLHILRGNFIISEIKAFHKKSNDSEWSAIASINKPDSADLAYFEGINSFTIQYYKEQKFDVSIFLSLADQSFLGILIGHKLDKSEFNDLDKITLQILLQVFDAAYRSFLNQRRVKALIFELNEKVVQLNNLIDTVIEVSRYDKRNILFDLALERIAPLTNASAALLQISSSDNIVQQYSFPPNIKSDNVLASDFKIESSFEFNGLSYSFTLAEKETRNGSTDFNETKCCLMQSRGKYRRQLKMNI